MACGQVLLQRYGTHCTHCTHGTYCTRSYLHDTARAVPPWSFRLRSSFTYTDMHHRLPRMTSNVSYRHKRFYYRKSLLWYSVQDVATACIFLAGKIEEDQKRLQKIMAVVNHVTQSCSQACENGEKRPKFLEPGTNVYFRTKDKVRIMFDGWTDGTLVQTFFS